MLIKKLQIKNFKGIHGIKEIEPEGLNILRDENGAGKTSILNALRFALTGQEPEGALIYAGEESTAVGVTLEDGNSYIRMKYADKRPSKCLINGRSTSAASMNEALFAATGVPVSAIKIASSQDLIRSLSKKELSELLLGYIPEELTLDMVKGYIPDLTPEKEELLSEVFEGEIFGIKEVSDAHERLFTRRRVVKKAVSDTRAVIAAKSVVKPEEGEKEALEKEREALDSRRVNAAVYAEQKKAYEVALKANDEQKMRLAEVDKALAALGEAKAVPDIEALNKELEELLGREKTMLGTIATLGENARIFTETLDKLAMDGCPLSDRLVCTADRAILKDDIQKSLDATKASQKAEEDSLTFLREQIGVAKAALDAAKAAKETEEKRAFLTQRREDIEKTAVVVPEPPKKGEDVTMLLARIKEIDEKLAKFAAYESVQIMERQLKVDEALLSNLDALVKALDANGIVKAKLVEYYLSVFEETVNAKAEQLKPGMRMRFASEAGVDVALDVRGDGNYLSFESLSGGEKVLYLYLMLDLFNQLSGARLLILDELSVLDSGNIDAMMNLVKADAENYDHVFVALTDNREAVSLA